MVQYTREQAAAMEERSSMYYRELILHHMTKEWQIFIKTSTDSDWTEDTWTYYHQALQAAAIKALEWLESNGNGAARLRHEVHISATPMERFLILSTTDTSQPWLARILAAQRGLTEGDMLNPGLREIGSQFAFRGYTTSQGTS
jgi:hypothetical protein